jgi:hypothetical protein
MSTSIVRPIIIVPGTGGTMLMANTSAEGNTYNPNDPWVWIDITAVGIDDGELKHNLTLKHAGSDKPSYEMLPAYSDVKVSTKKTTDDLDPISKVLNNEMWDSPQFYYNLINYLKSQSYVPGKTLWGFAYDWRLDWEKHYLALKNRIDQALQLSGADKVFLLGHSQGTQLIETFLLGTNYTSYQSKVAGVINIGALYYGAAVSLLCSIKSLGGYDFDIDLAGAGMACSTGYEIGKNSPAIYHMSPTAKYETAVYNTFGIKGSHVEKNVYYDWDWTVDKVTFIGPTNPPSNSHAFTQSKQYDQKLTSWTNTARAAWDSKKYNVAVLSIAGYGLPAEVACILHHDYYLGIAYNDWIEHCLSDGDGTVTTLSSHYQNSRSTRPTGSDYWWIYRGEHTAMIDSSYTDYPDEYDNTFPTVMAKIKEWLTRIGRNKGQTPSATARVADAGNNPPQDEIAHQEMLPVSHEREFIVFTAPRVDRTYKAKITDKATDKAEEITITGEGKVLRKRGGRTDVLLFVDLLTDADDDKKQSLGIQFAMKLEKDYFIELETTDGEVELRRHFYRSGVGEAVQARVLRKVTLAPHLPLKLEFRRGTSRFLQNGDIVPDKPEPPAVTESR